MASLLKIPRTVALITRSWQTAESQVRKAVWEKFWEADEEFITRMIIGELRAEFKSLNANREFEKAFSADLARFDRNLTWLAGGLVAQVTYHKKNIEAETGGDFGLLLVRPDVPSRSEKRPTMRHQGLLVQAKKQRNTGELGGLTPNQLEKFRCPDHLKYTAFLLYLYMSEGQHQLSPFTWIFPKTIDQIKADLLALKRMHPNTIADVQQDVQQRDTCPSVYDSTAVIEGLADGRMGTADPTIIRRDICPDKIPNIRIEINWPKGKPPSPPRVSAIEQTHLQQHQ